MNLLTFLILIITTFLSCGILILLNNLVLVGRDKNIGVQKFHTKPTSRLGGIAIYTGLFSYNLFIEKDQSISLICITFLMYCTPVFVVGALEDLTHKISPYIRLFFAIISSTLAYLYLDVKVIRTDIWMIDWLLQYEIFIYLFTILVITGFTHAINIIDGFNGLASGQVLLMLVFLSYLSYSTDQTEILLVSMTLLSVTFGFFMWNWPFGKIFLGDGGAYLLGFYVVCIGILLVYRSIEISPFAPIILGIYPLFEAIFSMYRRLLIRGNSPFQPDALHLHSLIFRRILKHKLKLTKNNQQINSKVANLYWIKTFIFGCLTCLFYKNSRFLFVLLFLYITFYIWIFNRIIKFKIPRWIFFC